MHEEEAERGTENTFFRLSLLVKYDNQKRIFFD